MEHFPCNFGVGDNVLVQIILQGAWTDEKPFADLSPREVDFTPEQRTMRLGNLPEAFAYFLDV